MFTIFCKNIARILNQDSGQQYYAGKNMTLARLEPDSTIDAQGLICPLPLLKAKQAIEKLEPGQILEVLGTDPVSKNDLQGWCNFSGHAFLGFREDGGVFRFYIKKV